MKRTTPDSLIGLIAALFVTTLTPSLEAATNKPPTRLPVEAKAKSKPQNIPTELLELEKKYGAAGTVTANFTQVSESGLMKTKKTSQGSLVFQRPDRVHWEEKTPEKSLLVSDGKTFWMYTPPFAEGERGQVLIQSARAVRTDLSRALLSAQFSTVKGLQIERSGDRLFTLTPKPGSAGTVVSAQIRLGAESGLVEWVKLEHQGGNMAEIRLENIELGTAVSSKFFTFQIPPKTEIIR